MGWIIGIGIAIWIIYSALSESKNKKITTKSDSFREPRPTYSRLPQKPKLNAKQIDLSSIKLSSQQEKLLNEIENSNKNIFITGRAGTGKSMLLQYFKQKTKKKVVVVAPTGVAALNIGGQTIHSLFQIAPGFVTKDKLNLASKVELLLKHIDAVVIDEISMVRADLMDGIAYLLEKARDNGLPFGGIQLIMFGDLYQLPPVVEDKELHKYFAHNHGGHYFFNAHCWQNNPLEIYELTEIFRQKDAEFKDILNKIREGNASQKILDGLNQRVDKNISEEGVITLVPTNSLVTAINHRKLEGLSSPLYTYLATIDGDLKESGAWLPLDWVLLLLNSAGCSPSLIAGRESDHYPEQLGP
jgi:Cdc6-like AAA superfamily ATPase